MPAPNLPGLILDRAHPLSNGLACWYPINEGAGRRANNVTGADHGLHIADPQWVGAGGRLTGHALTLNGASQYITVPHSTSISLIGDMSMVCWLRVSAWNWHMFFTKTSGGTSAPFMAYINAVRGTVEFHRGNGTLDSYVESTTPIAVNRWECIAVTMRGTAVTHYLNGARNGTGTLSTTIADSGNAMRLGNRSDGFWLGGQMANWRLYSRALSDSEISELYTNPMAGAYWDEGNGLPVITGILAKTLAAMTLSGSAVAPIFAALSKTLANMVLTGVGRVRNRDRSVYSPGGGTGGGGRRSTNIDHKGNRVIR